MTPKPFSKRSRLPSSRKADLRRFAQAILHAGSVSFRKAVWRCFTGPAAVAAGSFTCKSCKERPAVSGWKKTALTLLLGFLLGSRGILASSAVGKILLDGSFSVPDQPSGRLPIGVRDHTVQVFLNIFHEHFVIGKGQDFKNIRLFEHGIPVSAG